MGIHRRQLGLRLRVFRIRLRLGLFRLSLRLGCVFARLFLCLPAVAPGCGAFLLLILSGEGGSAALYFAGEAAFGDVAVTDSIRELAKMLDNLLDGPAAAEKVANNAVEGVAAIGPVRCAFPHDALDLVDAVLGHRPGIEIEAGLGLAELLLAPFAPHHGAIEYGIDVAEPPAGAELQPCDGEYFAGAPEQFDRAAVEREMPVQLFAAGRAPDPQAGAGRADFGVAAARLVEQPLGPAFDRTRNRIAHMVDINSGKRIIRSENITDAVATTGGGDRRFVRAPCAGIV